LNADFGCADLLNNYFTFNANIGNGSTARPTVTDGLLSV
jgi:hypothetical protein